MTQIKVNGHSHAHANGTANGHRAGPGEAHDRPHPQTTFAETSIDPSSFFGKLRKLYSEKVLKTQLEQLKHQGSYDAFKLGWHPAYEVRRLKGGKTRADGIPPSLFWESDVGKWIEAACYFLASPDGARSMHADEFRSSIQELVDMIERAQRPDGYLIIYFTVVDPAGRFQNLRDMHEMYNTGHLIEASLAHYHLTGSKQFLNVMIRALDCFMNHFGPEPDKMHGYPGHPEIELAILRLYQVTQDRRHLDFAQYLLAERGVTRADLGDKRYYVWEAEQRNDEVYPATMDNVNDTAYNQSHVPLHEQSTIEGHSVRALYLTTAAADMGGEFLQDAHRLWTDAVDKKMYATGGIGSRPRTEGFHVQPYHLPQSTDEGGCYAETCASIACMMTAERILSHAVEPKARDILERCLYNNVIGGGSLDGTKFSYANKHATYGNESAIRNDWFEVCCCPPNLSRTLGMLGGYTWAAKVDERSKTIRLDVYLLLSATRTIQLPNGETAKVDMESQMPWKGRTSWSLSAPEGWKWNLRLPRPEYAENIQVSRSTTSDSGFLAVDLESSTTVELDFDMPVQLLSSHPLTGQDNLTIRRGPIVYVAESVDNEELEREYPHFAGLGIPTAAKIATHETAIEGLNVVSLAVSGDDVFATQQVAQDEAFGLVSNKKPARSWKRLGQEIKLVPWFARANRGGAGHVRVALLRVDEHAA